MSADRTDIRLANSAWEALMTAHSALNGLFAAEGMWATLTMREYDVLYTLMKARSSGQPSQRISDVKQGVLLSQPALSRMIDRLAARGLIARATDPDDARAVRISITDAGAALQQEVGRAHAKSVAREVGTSLSPDEMKRLQALCEKLAASQA